MDEVSERGERKMIKETYLRLESIECGREIRHQKRSFDLLWSFFVSRYDSPDLNF